MSAVNAEQEREIEQAAEAELAVESPTPTEASAATAFSDVGPLPEALEAPVVAAAAGDTASTLAYEPAAEPASVPVHHRGGVHHWQEYKAECDAAGHSEEWNDKYRVGHTEADGWKQPYERRTAQRWDLKRGTSASIGLRAWLAGPTIADYRSLSVALDLLTLCQELGDRKFDQLFGSDDAGVDAAIPKHQRLQIAAAMFDQPDLMGQLREIAREADESPQRTAVEERRIAEAAGDDDVGNIAGSTEVATEVDTSVLGDATEVADHKTVV